MSFNFKKTNFLYKRVTSENLLFQVIPRTVLLSRISISRNLVSVEVLQSETPYYTRLQMKA